MTKIERIVRMDKNGYKSLVDHYSFEGLLKNGEFRENRDFPRRTGGALAGMYKLITFLQKSHAR